MDPHVSVVIPLRNELDFVAELLRSVLAQDYPADRLEVIVADGMSNDGTRETLAQMQRDCERILVIDNPGRIVSTGLNLALARARGDVIVRIDGHAVIEPDFIAENVRLLAEHPEAWSVGGPIRHASTTTFGAAAAIAMSHPLCVGNAPHRFPKYEGYVEGAQFPAFRRWVFDRVGTFDEHLVRNQDDELNYRIRRAGGKIYVSPRVRYRYFVRSRVGQLFTQYLQYGFWRIPVIRKHGRPATLRQVAPPLFCLVGIALILVGLAADQPLLAALLPLAYAAALLIAAAGAFRQTTFAVALRVPLAIAVVHAGYGWGLSYGVWARLLGRDAWNPQGKMAAISR